MVKVNAALSDDSRGEQGGEGSGAEEAHEECECCDESKSMPEGVGERFQRYGLRELDVDIFELRVAKERPMLPSTITLRSPGFVRFAKSLLLN